MNTVPELTWANLPDPALIALFKNMAVTDLVRIAFKTNERWHRLSMLNEVWESKYKQLYYQEEVRMILDINVVDDLEFRMRRISVKALFALRNYVQTGRTIFEERLPQNYFFVQFMLIWWTFPHVWRDKKGNWKKVQFIVPRFSQSWEDDERGFYTNFLKSVRPEKNYTWLSWNHSEQKVVIEYSKVKICLYNNYAQYVGDDDSCHDKSENRLYYNIRVQASEKTLLQDFSGILLKSPSPYIILFHIPDNGQGEQTSIYVRDDNGTIGFHTKIPSLNQIWYHNAPTEQTYDLMGCSLCGTTTQLVCGGCEQKSYCSQVCQATDFYHGGHRCLKNNFFVNGGLTGGAAMKRSRQPNSDLFVARSFQWIQNHVPVVDRKKFIQAFAKFISEDICEDLMWTEYDMEGLLRDDAIDFYFFSAEPSNREEIFENFVGLADATEDHTIKHLCSRGFGRRIFEWIDNEFGHPDIWTLEALPEAVGFWQKMGFRFLGERKRKHGDFIMDMVKRHGIGTVGSWLNLDRHVDPDDYQGSETYYDVLKVIHIANYYWNNGTYQMSREIGVQKPQTNTMHRYLK